MDEEQRISRLKNMWVGQKVISISNGFQDDPEDASLDVGVIKDIIPLSMAKNPTPVVEFLSGSNICFSTLLTYSDELWGTLQKLTPKERWDVIMAVVSRFKSE